MSHYGPKWAWDQNRPEAIEARRQAAEFHKSIDAVRRKRQAEQERMDYLENSPATHFRLAARHLFAFARGLVRFVAIGQHSP